MIDNFVGGYLNFFVIFLALLVFSPPTALIALLAAGLSFAALLLISHNGRKNAPKEAQANRDPTGAAIEYARENGCLFRDPFDKGKPKQCRQITICLIVICLIWICPLLIL